jgi:hypothetical protein
LIDIDDYITPVLKNNKQIFVDNFHNLLVDSIPFISTPYASKLKRMAAQV